MSVQGYLQSRKYDWRPWCVSVCPFRWSLPPSQAEAAVVRTCTTLLMTLIRSTMATCCLWRTALDGSVLALTPIYTSEQGKPATRCTPQQWLCYNAQPVCWRWRWALRRSDGDQDQVEPVAGPLPPCATKKTRCKTQDWKCWNHKMCKVVPSSPYWFVKLKYKNFISPNWEQGNITRAQI